MVPLRAPLTGPASVCSRGGRRTRPDAPEPSSHSDSARAAQVEGPDGLATQVLLDACLGVLAGSLDFTTWDNVVPTAIANVSVCSPLSPAASSGRRRLLRAASANLEPYASLALQAEVGAEHEEGQQHPALRLELERDGGAAAPGSSARGPSGRAAGPISPLGLAAPGAPASAAARPRLSGAPAARPGGPDEMRLGSMRRARALAEADAAAGAVQRARGAREALRPGRPGVPHRSLQAAAAGAAAPQPQPADGGSGGGGACENRTMVAIRMDLKAPVNATDVNNKARPRARCLSPHCCASSAPPHAQ